MRYTPILKSKSAELEALSTQQVNCDLEPIFEIQDLAWNPNATSGKSSGTDAAAFVDSLRRQWWRPAFVDLTRVATSPADRASWWALLQALTSMPGVPQHHLSPVLIPSDTPGVVNAAQGLAQNTGKALLRVQAPHASISSLTQTHQNIARALNLSPAKVELLIDWSDSTELHSLDHMESHVSSIVHGFQDTDARFIVSGTPNTSACAGSGQWDFDRREWWHWLRLDALGLPVDFSDYALFPPPSPGWGRPTYGHLRYSVDDTLHVERQQAPVGGLGAGFKICCDNLVRLGLFAGAGFSEGDKSIDGIVSGAETPPGASQEWRKIALQHHLSLVDGHLASPPSPPPAGTY